jgi:hypothetical protein
MRDAKQESAETYISTSYVGRSDELTDLGKYVVWEER